MEKFLRFEVEKEGEPLKVSMAGFNRLEVIGLLELYTRHHVVDGLSDIIKGWPVTKPEPLDAPKDKADL